MSLDFITLSKKDKIINDYTGRAKKRLYFAYRFYLKDAVQQLFILKLRYANKFSPYNLFNGKGKKALDVGCSYGYISRFLQHLGYTVVGIDLSFLALRKASRKIMVVHNDAQYAPFKQHAFDLIILFDIIEHVERPLKLIYNSLNMLNDNGVCLISTPHRGIIQKIYDIIRNEEHKHIFTDHSLLKSLKRISTSHIIIKYLLLPIPPNLFNRYFIIPNTPSFITSDMVIMVKRS
ncbi:MAG: class I SAM-dependent methyltransferase [Candidatus Methanomethylicaceae archaeon]